MSRNRHRVTDAEREEADAKRLIRHGTLNAYVYWRCRCEDCRAENARYHRELRPTRTPEMAPAHGKYTTYLNYNCRCDPCRVAMKQYQRRATMNTNSG